MEKQITTGTKLNVLSLEDSVHDFEIISECLIGAGFDLNISRDEKESAFILSLRNNTYDIILADYTIPGFDAFGAVRLANEICPLVPVICVSGSIGEEKAVELLKAGAVDYILKDRIERLPFAVNRALEIVQVKKEHKLAEEALKKSELRYRQLVEGVPDILYRFSAQKGGTYYSPQVEQLLGYSSEYLYTNPFLWNESIHPDDRERVGINLREFELGKFFDIEYRILDAQGNWRWLRDRSIARNIGDGEISIEGLATDITERKKAEMNLLRSENELKKAQQITHIGSWYLDLETNEVEWTEELYKMYGFDPALPPPPYTEHQKLFTPESWELLSSTVANTSDKGIPYELELRTVRKDGNNGWMWVRGETISDAEGKTLGLWGAAQDISERKQAEEKLRTSEAKFRAVAEISPMAIYASTGSDQKGIYINEAFYKIFGFSIDDIPTVGQWWIKAFPDEKYRQQIMDQWVYNIEQAAKNNTDVKELECICTCKDGSEKIIVWLGKTIGDEFWAFGYDITERKHAEEALKTSESEFRSLAESMPQIVWIIRPDGWNTYFNQQWVDYTGLTLEESYGHGWNKPFHPDDQQSAWDAWQNATQNRGIYSIESRLRRADGVYTWWLVRGVPILDEQGTILKWFGTCTDINESKLAVIALKESEEKFSIAFMTSPYAITITNPIDGKFIECNNAFTTISGYTREEAKADSAIGLEMWVDIDDRNQVVRDVLENNQVVGKEILFKKKNGEFMTGLFSAQLINFNNQPYILSSINDITYRKQAEETLRKNNSRLELAMHTANMAWWEMDIITGNVVFEKRKAEMLGYKPEKFSHYKDFMAIIHPEDFDKAMSAMQGHINGLFDKYEVEYRILTKSGKYKWFYDIGSIVKKDSKGTPLFVTGLVIDISERKQVEINLKNSQLDLRNFASHLQTVREEEKIELAREIHDDLGQVLVALKIDLGMSKKKMLNTIGNIRSEDVQQYFDNLSGMVDRTLKTARRIMSGLRPEIIESQGVIEASKLYIQDFEERFQISCQFVNSVLDLKINLKQSIALFRILQEALSNISKHANASFVVIKLSTLADKLIMEINDNGIGYDQNSKTRKDSYGLVGMKERVILLNGSLNVKSKVGEGTSIKVEILNVG